MDAAAKTVESLSQHILPERPHHLSYSPHWRYRDPGGSASRFEEWHNTRLQYMTLVSHADRGTLLTRSHYDMREEPPKPVPRDVGALARSGGEKKKLSLSDYKNKKTAAPPLASPPEPVNARLKESERSASAGPVHPPHTSAAPPRSANADAKPPPPDSHRPAMEFRKPDVSKPPDPQPHLVDAKMRPPRDGAIDMRLPPKPPSLPPKPPSPSLKKRVVDAEDESRPQKRLKPDDRRPADRPPPPRDDPSRRRERPLQGARDAPLYKDDRPSPSSSLPNGRPTIKPPMASARHSSPGARPRADAVNGVRPHLAGSNRSTPTKPDSSKSSVPPLLSPLHLSFDEHDRPRAAAADDDASTKKKRRDDPGDVGTTSNKPAKKTEASHGGKRNKMPPTIPPLLSPTLPPAVEAELQRRKKTSPEPADDRPKESKDAPAARKRVATGANDDEPSKLGHRTRLMVVFSIPKALRPSVRRILALPAGKRDGQAAEREREKERDRAGSDEASLPPAQARKRPIGAADAPAESVAAKRPRTSDVARIAATPSTPSKKSTTMSRVSSSNSMAQTPGETVNATPTAAPSADRRLNGQQDAPSLNKSERPERPEAGALYDKEERLKLKGKSLKHDADLMLRDQRSPNAASLKGKPGETKVKLGYVLSVESLVAFVMAFHAQNLWRNMVNKKRDYHTWDSMFPLIEFLQGGMGSRISNSRPLYLLLLLLQAVCLDEVLNCYSCHDPPPPQLGLDVVLRQQRKRARLWHLIRETNAGIAIPALRVDLHAWYTVDEVTDLALRLLRRWCSEEKVDWTPAPMLRDSWPIKPGFTRADGS